MNAKLVEAYDYYKSIHAPCCIFFRVNNECRAYFNDAQAIHQKLNVPLIDGDCVSFPYDDILDVISMLGEYDMGGVVVSQRNDSGIFDIPDVAQIKSDIVMDY